MINQTKNALKAIKYIVIFLVLSLIGYITYLAFLEVPPEWTGFGQRIVKPNVVYAKTLFDWLQLFIMPLSLALLGWSYKEFEKAKNLKIEEERSRNETLNSFFNVMTDLLQNHDLAGQPNVQTKAMAKTRINMTLSQLDGARKGQVLQFLYESDLIDINPRVRLLGANFNASLLDNIVLGSSEIRGANFIGSSMKDANLNGIILNSSNFEDANLSGSLVGNADFGYTNLKKCRLNNMDLTSVNFEGADLTKANLKGSKITQAQLDSIFSKEKIKLTKKLIQ